MKKVGIFGGSYNPIHIGHLALANYLCEFGDLNEVWFMVSPQNPFKAHSSDLWDDELRLELVRLAVEGYPKLHPNRQTHKGNWPEPNGRCVLDCTNLRRYLLFSCFLLPTFITEILSDSTHTHSDSRYPYFHSDRYDK